MNWFLLLAAVFLTFQLHANAQNPNNEKMNASDRKIAHLMDVHLEFLNMVPPGMSIEAKEISRSGVSGKDLRVVYHIYIQGAPQNAVFRWVQWPINQDKATAVLDGITRSKDGLLVCAGRTDADCGTAEKLDDPIDFITMPITGEPVRLAFVASNLQIGIVLIPDPLEGSNNGCTLSATRLTPNFELALISGTGFVPRSDVHYEVCSSGVVNKETARSDNTGRLFFSVIPYPGDAEHGVALVQVAEPNCSPQVSFEWGHK